jgi:glutamine phosphoribosylpyrophosphate amidotransferase
VGQSGEWLLDSEDYYFHISGIAFIKFIEEKNMVLWRDNNHEKRSRDIKKEDSRREYVKFFEKAAVCELIGEIIEDVCYTACRFD